MPENTDAIWLTQDAHDKLADELESLKTEGRPAVTDKIASARAEGDLSENGGYHAAREEQGQMEARIRQLEDMLRRAKVGKAPASGKVAPGSRVTVAYDGDLDDTDTFILGSREMLGLDVDIEVDVFSPQSPLGDAVLGAGEGDAVTYRAPNGRTIAVTVVKVEAHG
ncbi:MAG: transcription elongation factor GreA [Propionibacterium sp.]|nr:transcription elongation factor GreA [Propionibacterium sp.]